MDTLTTLLILPSSAPRTLLRETFEKPHSSRVTVLADGQSALKWLAKQSCSIIYVDAGLTDPPGIEVAETLLQQFPHTYILMGAAAPTPDLVIAAMRAGIRDFIIDPENAELVKAAADRAIGEVEKNRLPTVRDEKKMVTQDPVLLRVLSMAEKVAPTTATVLITGESGTGKELLAAFLHARSAHPEAPYVAVNCAALPEQLAESELFGHEKGSFTGAVSRKIGKFESAGKGTLVLDEITEMSPPLQAKLLRALQEREIVRLGSNQPISVAARIIAISNRDIKKAVADHTFREDLYYRLGVIPLTIPPLRDRKADIPLLADYFFKRFSKLHDAALTRILPETMDLLKAQEWPGNVRELENTIERGVLISSGDTLLPEHLLLEAPLSETDVPAPGFRLEAGMTVRDMEKELIRTTLHAVQDNRTHAAKMLGISIRTLRNKLNEYRDELNLSDS
ncbi:sigma-54 dependent transcriptional regulator [Desulfosarcina sp. OttesenSCG-928-G10]|nr:sigma-54 dependent transcriptional regulator [Desulfosarcina sp. OttesenSCG-928-G10]MDL2322114.1 sigma-54 dependent transcriptional regulator [Desulfosarcina sp. OttesenSCG-928-B08]